MTVKLNDNLDLIYEFKSGMTYNASDLYNILIKKHEELENAEIIEHLEFSKKIKIEEKTIYLSIFPLTCNFKELGEIIVYSIEHLKLIFEKLDFSNPIYCTENSDDFTSLLNPEWEIFLEGNIFIENNLFSENDIKNIFNEQKELIDKFTNCKFDRKKFSYNIISYNLRNYLDLISINNLKEDFFYADSRQRRKLQNNIEKFMNDKANFIYGIYGPYGIGKSLTSLIIQKSLYIKKYRSIYINLKFYYKNNISSDIKFQTLLSECFFLCNDLNEFELYHRLLLNNRNKNIWVCLGILYNYIKNIYKDLSKFFFIIDQYKKGNDINNSLFNFPDIHIFVLSSINDKDIKSSLISILKSEEAKIHYIYIPILINDTINEILCYYKKKVINKLPNEKYVSDEEKFEFISKILELFGNLPRFISLLLNKYNNIFDLLNEEYKKIFSKLIKFYKYSNLKTIIELRDNDYISKLTLKSISKDDFIYLLNDIPLKYINFKDKNNSYYLEYAFPLCEKVFDDYILYNKDIDTFKIINKDNDPGNGFEYIFKISLRVFDKFQIDGYIEVDSILKLNLGENYDHLDKHYFLNKKNILFATTIQNAKSFDFSIYKPDINVLILLQAKYIINNKSVTKITNIKTDFEEARKAFVKKFNVTIDKVYFLYVSSFEYNENRKRDVLKYLKTNSVNCIFFNCGNKASSFDFQNKINEIPLNDSYLVYPFPKVRNYNLQWKEEETIINEESNPWNDLLNKKRYKDFGKKFYLEDKKQDSFLVKLYENFIKITKFKYQLKEEIISHLGNFVEFYYNSFGKNISFPITNIYIFVFNAVGFMNNGEIDLVKELGLIYHHENKFYFLDIKKNAELDEEEFHKKFNYYCYAIGKYKK